MKIELLVFDNFMTKRSCRQHQKFFDFRKKLQNFQKKTSKFLIPKLPNNYWKERVNLVMGITTTNWVETYNFQNKVNNEKWSRILRKFKGASHFVLTIPLQIMSRFAGSRGGRHLKYHWLGKFSTLWKHTAFLPRLKLDILSIIVALSQESKNSEKLSNSQSTVALKISS